MKVMKTDIFLADIDISKCETGQWSVCLEYSLKTRFKVDAKDEIVSILMKNFVEHINSKNTIKEVVNEISERTEE